MSYLKSTKIELLPYLSLAVILFSYTTYRAINLSFTIDESQTFNEFVPLSFMDIVSYKMISGNNHIINTLLMKVSSNLIGTSELVLRMQSLLAHLLYLFFSFLISRRIQSFVLAFGCFVLLNVNPYMLDFFSLARGYALAVAFMIISVYYLLLYKDETDAKKTGRLVFQIFLFALLACLSNFCLFLYYFGLWAAYLIVLRSKFDLTLKMLLKENRMPFFFTVLLTIISFEPIRKLHQFGAIYGGGQTGFWHDTVGTILQTMYYQKSYSVLVNNFVNISIIVVSVVVFGGIAFYILFRKNKLLPDFVLISVILFISFVLSEFQHLLLGSDFLTDRMAIFLVPLFLLCFAFLLYHFFEFRKGNIAINGFVILLAILSISHLAVTANLHHTFNWQFNADVKEMLSDLTIERKRSNIINRKIKLAVSWPAEESVNFYIKTKKLNWLEPVTRDPIKNAVCDYIYANCILPEDCDYVRSDKQLILKTYTLSNTILAKVK